jgi:hypothetical protein
MPLLFDIPRGADMKQALLTSAGLLCQPSESVGEEFASKIDQLVARCNQAMDNRTDREKLIGPGNRDMARDNTSNFARFMQAQFANYNPEVMVETVLWVFQTYRSHGFRPAYWAVNLNIWMEMLKDELSPQEFEAVSPFYEWLIVNIPVFTHLSDDASANAHD